LFLQNPVTGGIFELLVRVVSDVKPKGAGNGQHEAPGPRIFQCRGYAAHVIKTLDNPAI
jgi:hypothetical protein